jgi:hypothetical protein
MLTFWLMVGVALMTGVDSFRRRPNDVTIVISLALIAAVMAYIVQGYYDMGLYWFRIAILMGCLMGAMDAVRRIDAGDRTKNEPLPDRHQVGIKPGKKELESAA